MEKLLIISIDSYRRDNIGKLFQGMPISDFITSLVPKSVFYDNYFASANWTIPSYASMFTGKATIEHNFWGYRLFPGQDVKLIFDDLAAKRIRSSLICCGVLAEADVFQLRNGNYFATAYDVLNLDNAIDLVQKRLYESDLVFFHTFLMHDYFDHKPYRSPRFGLKRRYEFVTEKQCEQVAAKMREWRKTHFALTRDQIELNQRIYYNECLLVDDFIEKLIEVVLSDFPCLRIIINSDHGECFNHCGKPAFGEAWQLLDHPLWHHSGGLCFEQFEVFAIDYGGSRHEVRNQLIDHEDIYWMIMEFFGLSQRRSQPKQYNLISTSFDKVGFCGVLIDGKIYLYDRNKDFEFVLADGLRTNRPIDPDPQLVEKCRAILKSRSVDLEDPCCAQESVYERLRGWGYM